MGIFESSSAILLKVSIAIFLAFWGGKLARRLHLPNVSGYVIIGMLLGPSLGLIFKNYGGFINAKDSEVLSFIGEITIAFIAFSIGAEFTKKSVQKMGKSVYLMTIFQTLFAVVFVTVAIYFLPQKSLGFDKKEKLTLGLILGAIAAATAPAATLMVMRQYKAYGPVSRMTVGITALDDVLGIVVFGFLLAISKIILGMTGNTHIALLIFTPIIEIIGSVFIGFVVGILAVKLAGKFDKARDDIQVLLIALILFIIGLTKVLSEFTPFTFSSLLANIVMGTLVANLVKKPKRSFDALNDAISTFYVMFFTFAGATLNLNIIKTVGVAGVVYIITRFIGKYFGTWLGAKLSKENNKVAYLTGLALMPQGGISIGLLLVLSTELPKLYVPAATIVMASILFYETLGPLFAKIAIEKAGEIGGAERFMQGEYDLEKIAAEEAIKEKKLKQEKKAAAKSGKIIAADAISNEDATVALVEAVVEKQPGSNEESLPKTEEKPSLANDLHELESLEEEASKIREKQEEKTSKIKTKKPTN